MHVDENNQAYVCGRYRLGGGERYALYRGSMTEMWSHRNGSVKARFIGNQPWTV